MAWRAGTRDDSEKIFKSFWGGHKSSKTTEIYTYVSNKDLGKIKSPLDLIMKNSDIAKLDENASPPKKNKYKNKY